MSPTACGKMLYMFVSRFTASPATFPLAGLEHHIEIFGSEGSETQQPTGDVEFWLRPEPCFSAACWGTWRFHGQRCRASRRSSKLKVHLRAHEDDARTPRARLTLRRSGVASHGKPGQTGDSLLGGHSKKLCLGARASSHVSLTSTAWAFWSGLCWPWELPRSIKLQVYQSTCMIIQNAKDIGLRCFLRPSPTEVLCTQMYPGLKKWRTWWFGFATCSASFALCSCNKLCDHFVMGWN